MEILTWQACIVFGIVFSTLLFGRRGFFLSALASVVWTIAMVFTTWLFILQLLTIVVACKVGLRILRGSRFEDRMAVTRNWTLASIALTVIGSILFNINSQSSPPVSAAALVPKRMSLGAGHPSNEPTVFNAAITATSNSADQHEKRNERPTIARNQPLHDTAMSQQAVAPDAPSGDLSYDAIYARELKKTNARLLQEQIEFEARLELARQRPAQGPETSPPNAN